jgi:hypothetical protein
LGTRKQKDDSTRINDSSGSIKTFPYISCYDDFILSSKMPPDTHE